IHVSTIGIAPYLHLDEFMIIDLGRIVMNPGTDWSIAWLPGSDQPVFFWFYLGSVVQELVFQLAGEYGPRIFALAGALVAARVMLAYLLLRRTRRIPAAVLSLVFLLDPLFVQSYSMGRLDSWTLACGLFTCVLLRQAELRPQSLRRPSFGRIILAGSFMSIGWLIWPSSVFLLPLILIDLRGAALSFRTMHLKTSAIGYFALGCVLTALALMLPLAPVVMNQLQSLGDGIATNTRSGSPGSPLTLEYHLAQFRELIRILKFTPVVVILAAIGCLIIRKKSLVYALLAAAGIMLFTVVYIHRVQYLLPYLIALIASLFAPARQPAYRLRRRRPGLKLAGLAALLLWCTGLSVITRTLLALEHRQERNRDLVSRAAESMVGAGHHGVLMPGEFYYAGRRLGWKMYKPYLAQNEPLRPETLEKVLPHLEYVIWSGSSLPLVFKRALTRNGLHEQGTLQIYRQPMAGRETPSWLNGIRNLFSLQRQPYGPYILYARDRKPGR
ncbi:MAG TPA: hypothetical protein VGD92_00385, partial [Sphingobacteriaceae bacterium]